MRSDIYFLGCIYYHMLTGQPPLTETRDRLLRLSKQRFLDVVPIQKADRSLPACVTIVVNKAMALDPSLRSRLADIIDFMGPKRDSWQRRVDGVRQRVLG